MTLTGTAAINGTGNDLNNLIIGNSSNNRIDGGLGADNMRGGAGNDTYVVDNSSDVVTENANEGATDTVEASISYALTSNIENLTLTGTAAINGTGNGSDNTIIGNDNSNILTGGAGADTLNGGLGNDTASYSSSNSAVIVSLLANASNTGGDAQGDKLSNIENITGSAHNDTLTGDGNANVLDGGAGADTLTGGNGNDTYIVDNTGDVVKETDSAGVDTGGVDTIQSSVTFTLSANVENLTLTGTNVINGTGNSLDNTIIGNDNSNILTGGAGADTLNGGLGNDTASYSSSNSAVIVSLLANASNTGGDAQGDKLSNIENITGSAHNDTLTGDGNANVLDGGTGADTLIGGNGNDTYVINTVGDKVTESASQGTDTIRISGISSFNLNQLQASNIETLDLKSDTSSNSVTFSASIVQSLVGAGNNSILTLRIGAEDNFTIDNSAALYTQGQSIKFYSDAAHTTQIAQVNFTYV